MSSISRRVFCLIRILTDVFLVAYSSTINLISRSRSSWYRRCCSSIVSIAEINPRFSFSLVQWNYCELQLWNTIIRKINCKFYKNIWTTLAYTIFCMRWNSNIWQKSAFVIVCSSARLTRWQKLKKIMASVMMKSARRYNIFDSKFLMGKIIWFNFQLVIFQSLSMTAFETKSIRKSRISFNQNNRPTGIRLHRSFLLTFKFELKEDNNADAMKIWTNTTIRSTINMFDFRRVYTALWRYCGYVLVACYWCYAFLYLPHTNHTHILLF